MSYQRVNDVSDELISAVKELPFIRTHLFNALNPPKQNVVILKGARGVGKSTLLLQFLLKKKTRKYQGTVFVSRFYTPSYQSG